MDIKFAMRLQGLRKENGYSQEALAEKLGVSRQAVSKWECGTSLPDTENLIALSKLYNISVDAILFDGEDNGGDSTDIDNKECIIKECDNSDYEKSAEEEIKKKHDILGIVSGMTVFICIITYILLGTLLKMWHPGWIVFFAIPVIPSLIESIIKKDGNIFCFPLVVTAIYLLIGCQWSLWHPWWVMFFLIPIYYLIFKKRNK